MFNEASTAARVCKELRNHLGVARLPHVKENGSTRSTSVPAARGLKTQSATCISSCTWPTFGLVAVLRVTQEFKARRWWLVVSIPTVTVSHATKAVVRFPVVSKHTYRHPGSCLRDLISYSLISDKTLPGAKSFLTCLLQPN